MSHSFWRGASGPRMVDRIMVPQRIQLQRTKGWRMPANTLKVDRSTIFGNPFISEGRKVLEAVAMFENWLCDPHWEQTAGSAYPPLIIKQLSARRRDLLASLANLRGYNLACWCSLPNEGEPDLCHAAVLLRLANA